MIRLYVGNLPHHATEQDVVNWFNEAGVSVENSRIMRDLGSGTSKGCGFVDVEGRQNAIHAIRVCNGARWLGRILVVKSARPPVRRRVRVEPGQRHTILRPPLRIVAPVSSEPTLAHAAAASSGPAENAPSRGAA
jgi:RNA recognition motif-containing protein